MTTFRHQATGQLLHPDLQPRRYLASLLESLVVQLDGFPYSYELVIADNASPDATGEVVRGFAERLPIRYLRHDENIGCFANVQFVMMQAAGRYVVYLADDDCILGGQVAQTIARMEADAGIVVVYRTVEAVRPGRAAGAGHVLRRARTIC